MTRINLVPVEELTRQHLVAELHEILRLPNNLRTSLNRKSKPFSMSEIPSEYTLGKGHVKFFYDKMLFLQKRFGSLVSEMKRRGYKVNFTDDSIFSKCSDRFYYDYMPTEKALQINRERIKERSK